MTVDDQGNIYIVGGTSSPDFPVTAGAYSTHFSKGGVDEGSLGDMDAFVAKLDPTGHVIWATYLGGINYDRAYAVEVDAAHNVYVAGRAGIGFPIKIATGASKVVQPVFGGDNSGDPEYGKQDGFIAKLSADGSQLLWSTYFGDTAGSIIRDIDVDSSGRVYVGAGVVIGTGLDAMVTADAIQKKVNGYSDSFFARIAADGSHVEYGTYLGGNDPNSTSATGTRPSVRVTADGSVYFLSIEIADGAPTTPNAAQPHHAGATGTADLLLTKFSPTPTGSLALSYCTYIGGSAGEGMETHALAVNANGEAIVTGFTLSSDYPVTDGSRLLSSGDTIVTIVSADGKSFVHSRYFGSTGGSGAEGIAIGPGGNIYVSGGTTSTVPATPGALFPTNTTGQYEGYLAVYTPDLSTLLYSSFTGVSARFVHDPVYVDSAGKVYIAGTAWHLNPFPATAGLDNLINGDTCDGNQSGCNAEAVMFQVYTPNP